MFGDMADTIRHFESVEIRMPWEEKTVMDQRKEFVRLATQEGANIRELCRRYGVGKTTAYKWLSRYEKLGEGGLKDQSRRPINSPKRSIERVEAAILKLRQAHPKWGARKLKRWLEDRGVTDLPCASTVHAILQRHGQIDALDSEDHQPWKRFEHAESNDLWQMDFKGHFATETERCHPLTILDDHSRFVVCLGALGSESYEATMARLITTFRRYGMPRRMTMDNGSPWGDPGRYTRFELQLMALGIQVSHSRPYHPQTQGKDERFHRTLKAEVLQGKMFKDLTESQRIFDDWLHVYNQERPHDALQLATPASRYTSSPRAYPEKIVEFEYDMGDEVRKVQSAGELYYRGETYVIGKAFHGEKIALRKTPDEHVRQVYFGTHHVANIALNEKTVSIVKHGKNA
jgi:transposase InsO family protein